jgi:hypothetical protein
MQLKRIEDTITELKVSNSKNKYLIEQLKFIGAVPVKESKTYTYFRFNGTFADCERYLGIG